MRFLKALFLLSILLTSAIAAITFFVPQILVQSAVQLKIQQRVVLGAPNRCSVYLVWLKQMPPDLQQKLAPELLQLAELDPDTYQKKLDSPEALTKLIATVSGGNSNHDLSLSCLQRTLSVLQGNSKAMIELFKKKTTKSTKSQEVSSWQEALVTSCQGQIDCAKALIEEYQKSQPQQRERWLEVLSGIGKIAAEAALEQLAALKDLRFYSDDTAAATHQQAELLAQIFVASQLQNKQKLLDFTLASPHPLPLRWRVAMNWARMAEPHHELWPLAEQVMNDPQAGVACRREALLRFGPLWNSHQQLVSELARQFNDLAARLPSAVDGERELKEQITVIKAFTSTSRDPQSVQPALPEEDQKTLSESLGRLTMAIQKRWGKSSKALDELLVLLRTHPLFAKNTSVVKYLLRNPDTAALGLDLLLGDDDLDGPRLNILRESYDDLPPTTRLVLSQKANEPELLIALLPAIPAVQAVKMWKPEHAPIIRQQLEKWAKQDGVHPALKVGFFMTALYAQPRSPKVRLLRQSFTQSFKCEPEWIRMAQLAVENGPTQVGFGPAVMALLTCPENQVNNRLLGAILLNPKAQKQIKRELAISRAKPEQLKRLTSFFSMANRVPGSSLPAKVKNP
ncbi:MAG: hypothetical protein AB7N80_05435 [Bdellovibrionales bacterium]